MNQVTLTTIAQRLAAVREQIARAEQKFGRIAGSVQLLAVSKTRPAAELLEAMQAGQTMFGENYLQDALPKIEALQQPKPEWHFIGPIQSNKTREIAEHFDWVHSVDRLKIARRLNEQRPHNLPALNVCIQVNIDNEPSKSGASPDETLALAREIQSLSRLRLRGLMAIPTATDEVSRQREAFARLRELSEQIQETGIELDTLSMGMSNDLEAAIAEGATMVRIGTAIFGARLPRPDQAG
jgi:pyridoxal phosphate enzyme (YggS family)